MSSIRYHLNDSLSPLLNSTASSSSTTTANTSNSIINSPTSPSLAFISINSNTNSTSSTPSQSTFSFRRTSLNLAHRICGRNPSNRASLPLTPRTPNSPTANSFNRSYHQTPLSRSKCPCCSSILAYHINSNLIQCPTCSIQWDLFPPAPTNHQSINLTISTDLVRTLRSLALSPHQLKAFDEDPKKYIQTHQNPASIEKFYSLAAETLTSLFDSTLNISSAFSHRPTSSSGRDHTSSPIGLRIKLARAFFLAIINGPGGRDLLSAQLSRFLSRPGYQIWSIVSSSLNNRSPDQSMPNTSDWAWAAVLFECVGILAHSGLPITTRFSNTSRLLGL
ncbi:hypothetical protein DFH28DRAFT_13865 [Melampsora americana]|nr:hypothetical protein DFH28DRAFT_13865 [Melampsora americana]